MNRLELQGCLRCRRPTPHRFRGQADAEGFPIIPGRYGQVEWFDGRELAVDCDHPKLFRKLLAIENVWRHQTGDDEIRAVFPLEAFAQVGRGDPSEEVGRDGEGTAREFSFRARAGDHFPARGGDFRVERALRARRRAQLAIETRK